MKENLSGCFFSEHSVERNFATASASDEYPIEEKGLV